MTNTNINNVVLNIPQTTTNTLFADNLCALDTFIDVDIFPVKDKFVFPASGGVSPHNTQYEAMIISQGPGSVQDFLDISHRGLKVPKITPANQIVIPEITQFFLNIANDDAKFHVIKRYENHEFVFYDIFYTTPSETAETESATLTVIQTTTPPGDLQSDFPSVTITPNHTKTLQRTQNGQIVYDNFFFNLSN